MATCFISCFYGYVFYVLLTVSTLAFTSDIYECQLFGLKLLLILESSSPSFTRGCLSMPFELNIFQPTAEYQVVRQTNAKLIYPNAICLLNGKLKYVSSKRLST